MTTSTNAEFWESAWTNKRTGWDIQGPTPALLSVLKSHATLLFPTSQETVLIPGVGRGYDVVAIALDKPGVKVIGLDISATGVSEAQKELDKANLGSDRAQVLLADFFEYSPTALFSVVFRSYISLCHQPISPFLMVQQNDRNCETRRILDLLHVPLERLGRRRSTVLPFYWNCMKQLLGSAFDRVFQRDLEPHEFPTAGMDRTKYGKQMISLWVKRI
ncbi:S-adenosyl-L-methionine-dependent methyltransferase [Obelidium mucronatum]|nr:S-adenosyl-L-methionine-dependent methyltransferase [Obelidium mucronatum]